MISDIQALYSKENVKRIKRIYKRLCIPMDPVRFLEVLAKFSEEIANNPLAEAYIKIITKHQEEYRLQPDIASILSKASFNPTGKQALDQEMLKRTERKSEYYSFWIIRHFNEIYDISLHERIRAELTAKNDLNGLAHFEAEIIAVTNILNGNSDVDVTAFYLPYAHHVMSEIIQFFDKQNSIHVPTDNSAIDPIRKSAKPFTRLEFKKKKSLLLVNGKQHLINTPLQLRYIGLFFKRDGSLNGKIISDDEIHSKVFSSNVDTRDSEFKKAEKDQVAGLKRHFKDFIQVKNRKHSVKAKYHN